MKTVSEYRAYAEECRTLARQMDGAHREQLLDMARTWDRLAADLVRPGSERAPDMREDTAQEDHRGPNPRV
jgi:hypothetical protein